MCNSQSYPLEFTALAQYWSLRLPEIQRKVAHDQIHWK